MFTTRRRFIEAAVAGGTLAGMSDLGFLATLPRVSAEETKTKGIVSLNSDIEPLVRLLEETPRERLLEEVASRIRTGTTYKEVLAALLLAGVRNVQPRPVGFKFHAVLVVNSAHLASISCPEEHRWLPIFWALDYFKDSQAQDARQGDWTMAPVDEAAVPDASKAKDLFVEAMNEWDEAKADAAAAGLARTGKSAEVYELFSRFGCRDFRDIGHKAIYVANSWRTLDHIGWEHAEPVLRSLAYALLEHGDGHPVRDDLDADRPGRKNLERAKTIGAGWQEGKPDDQATSELLATLHGGSADDACQQVVEMLNRGVAPQSIWDALLVGSGELLARQSGIVSLHAVTSSNALYYAYRANSDDSLRRLLLLQAAAFVPLFRGAMQGRGRLADVDLRSLSPAPIAGGDPLAEIFTDVSGDRTAAARKTLGFLQNQGDAKAFVDAARLLVFLKGDNAHDYKFSSALLEDYTHLSPGWRERYLASGVFNLRGSGDRDNKLVERTRAAIAG
ncbi:MAG TPA: hypothetical protein VHC22_05175 [Pirellulales bacterium]|nr:hypothetical protein [Pirellulales bacterium]